jgi:ATP-dependent helicase HrpA
MSSPDAFATLEQRLPRALLRDQRNVGRQLARLKRERTLGPAALAERLAHLTALIERSVALRARREAQPLRLEFPPELPVSARREEIARAIAAHPVVVVCGETGSGKSTQLPKICLELGRGSAGLIGHTQPRRLAARTLATRLSEEVASPLGQVVGFKVRFGDHTSAESRVKLMTDGILLQETLGDRRLEAYDTLIIDEAHERSLNIDFLLGYLKTLLPRRPDLKLVITSATLDPERIAGHFGGAPIIEVSGRSWPIELRWRPLVDPDDPQAEERDLVAAVVEAVKECDRIDRGDILVFLPGERDIRDVEEALRRVKLTDTDIRPLYARLGVAEQNAIFSAHARRHVVLATNVAETSVTVPGVRFVVDSGLVRLSRYSPRTKVQRLPIEPVSQASANQRMGRCGRVGPGVCIRLYSEADFNARMPFTDPEVLRTSLASVILRLAALDFGRIEAFPFIEAPEGRQVSDGYRLLEELGALDASRRLTPLGRELAKLPVDPRIGRMIIGSREHDCVAEVLVIASALSVQDMRERPPDAKQKADEAHALFADERSDFLWYLNLWRAWNDMQRHLSRSKQKAWLREHFLSALRMREWTEVHSQLTGLLHDMGYHTRDEEAPYERIHRALLTGLLGNVALRTEQGGEYLGARNLKLAIFPGSTLARRKARWVMAAELTETGRTWARTVASVEPEWIEQAAGPLLKWSYSEPHWQRRSGRVVGHASVSLFGLVLASKRRVDYGPVDPAACHAIFLREALVAGEVDLDAPFLRHNAEAVQAVEALQHRFRRLDLLVDEETRFRFYAERVPEHVHSLPEFEKWRREAERSDPRILCMDPAQLFRVSTGEDLATAYPEEINLDGLRLPLVYRYTPTEPDDGVTLLLPLALLNQVPAERVEWLVPGLLQEKLEALLRGLPKSLRRPLVPIPETVRRLRGLLVPGLGSLYAQLVDLVAREFRVTVSEQELRQVELERHLYMNVRIVADDSTVLAESRDFELLRRRFGTEASEAATRGHGWADERSDVLRFDIEHLPEEVVQVRPGYTVKGYPAFVDLGKCAGLSVFDTPEAAQAALRGGLVRLIALTVAPQLAQLRHALPNLELMCRQYKPLGSPERFRGQLMDAAVARCFLADEVLPRSRDAFEACLQAGRPRLQEVAQQLARLAAEVLRQYEEVSKRLAGPKPPAWLRSMQDVAAQVAALVPTDFLTRHNDDRLRQLPRYLKAVRARLDRLQADAERDRRKQQQVAEFWEPFRERWETLGNPGPLMVELRWLIEEYRVSLFAQELGTASPVSPERLRKLWLQARNENS